MKRSLMAFVTGILCVCLLLYGGQISYAADVTATETLSVGEIFTDEDSGIHYKVTGESTVAVISNTETAQKPSTYTGTITIGDSVTHNSTSYTVTEIDSLAFESSSVQSVSIPATVTTIGRQAFSKCTSLTSITFAENSQLATLGSGAFNGCSSLTTLSLPSSVTSIGSNAFSGCTALESITIPSRVTENLMNALDGYNNDILIAENSPYDIEGGVLYKNRTTIEGWIDKSVTDIIIRDGVTEIPYYTFGSEATTDPKVRSIVLPASVKKIDEGAFRNSALTTIDLSNVETIGKAAFSGSENLANIDWPDNLQEMQDEAFNMCTSLQNVVISGSITEIPDMAFSGCVSLQRVSLSEGISTIGQYAFDLTVEDENNNYTNPNPQLASINIPSTVKSVDANFLGGVSNTTALIFEGNTPPTFESDALSGISGEGATSPIVYYPADAVDAYTATNSALVTSNLVTAPKPGEKPANSFALAVTQPSVTLYSGDQFTLNVQSVVPTGGKLQAESSNSSVATVEVTDDGAVIVRSLGRGSAIITVSVVDEKGNVLTSQSVTVSFAERPYTGDYNYPVTIGKTEHGTVTIAKEDQWANDGEKITVTVTPDDAYMLDKLVIKDKAGKELQVKDNGDGTYTFTMPEGAVTITATFVEDPDWVEPEPEEPTPEPSTDVTDIFNDVTPGAWYVDVVQYAYDHGLMTGTSATTFEPDTTTSRAMIVSILHRLEGSPSVGTSDFSDVASGAWYADPVAWAAENGIVAGFENGTFGPNDPITREQMAAILYNYAEYKGIDTSARATLDSYSDAGSISPWATDGVSWANAVGLMNGVGDNTLDPQGTATRAQVAAMLQRFIENVL